MNIECYGKKLNEKQMKFVQKRLSELDLKNGRVVLTWRKNKGLHWVLEIFIEEKRKTVSKIGKKFYSLVTEIVNEFKN